MIKRSNDRIWVGFSDGNFYLLGPGFTHVEEVCKTALLETPNINSPLCTQEILYHTGHLEFEGYRIPTDPVQRGLLSRYMTRGKTAQVTLIIGNRTDQMSGQAMEARRVTGSVCIENPGSGEGPMGSFFKGKIIFSSAPEKGTFLEKTKQFISYNQ